MSTSHHANFEVGKHKYMINMWSPDKAIENMVWLVKICGEPLFNALTNAGSFKKLLDSEADLNLLAPSVKHLFMNLHDKEIAMKFSLFCDGLHCNGPVDYKTHFIGRPGHLIKVVIQILKEQYKDFFEGIPAGMFAKGSNEETETGTTQAE